MNIRYDTRYESPDAWRQEAIRRFGKDPLQWKFACPSCGHIASVADWQAVGASEGEVAFSCVGRHMEKPAQMGERPGPCNYAGGGLIRINPVEILDGDKKHHMFDFAQ
jgi:hypothetical protein